MHEQLVSLKKDLLEHFTPAGVIEESEVCTCNDSDPYYWAIRVTLSLHEALRLTENREKASWELNTSLGALHDTKGRAFVFLFARDDIPKNGAGKISFLIPIGKEGILDFDWFHHHIHKAVRALSTSLNKGELFFLQHAVPEETLDGTQKEETNQTSSA